MALQDDVFDMFVDGEEEFDVRSQVFDSTKGQKESKWLGNINKIPQPEWLAPKYIRQEHCDDAAAKLERRGSNDRTDSSMCDDESISTAAPDDRSKKAAESNKKSKGAKKNVLTRRLDSTSGGRM